MLGRFKRLPSYFTHLGMIFTVGLAFAVTAPTVYALTDEEADAKLREIGFNVDDPSFPPDLLDAFRDMVRTTESGFQSQGFASAESDNELNSLSEVNSGSSAFFGEATSFSKEPNGDFQVYQMTVNPDRSVTLRWEGASDKVFDIEVSRDLVNWTTVIKDHPSDNGFSIWTDRGNLLPRIQSEHPADSDRRFYRIRASDTLPSVVPTGSVSLTSYDSATGIASFEVNPQSSGSVPIDSVSLLVSGVEIGKAYDAPYVFNVDTRSLWNGEHEIRAIIRDDTITDPPAGILGREIGEAAGIVLTAPVSLTTDNFASSFRIKHQAFDPDDDQIQVVYAKLQESASWTVEAKKFTDQSVVWSTSGESDLIHVTWDGLDQNQQPIESGRYSIVLTVDEPEPLEPGIQSQSSVQHILEKAMSKLGPH